MTLRTQRINHRCFHRSVTTMAILSEECRLDFRRLPGPVFDPPRRETARLVTRWPCLWRNWKTDYLRVSDVTRAGRREPGDEVARPAALSGRWVQANFPEQRLVIEPKKSVSHVWNTKRCTNQCFHNCGMCCLLFLNRYLSSTTPNWSRLPKPIYRSDKGRVFNEWVSTWTSYLITKVCSDKLKERYITCNLAKFVPHVFGLFISWHVRTISLKER